MRWTDRGRSENVEDRRGQGGLSGIPLPRGPVGCVIIIIILVASIIFKKDFFSLLQGGGGADVSTSTTTTTRPYQGSKDEEKLVNFVSFVLDDAQGVWARKFATLGRKYSDAHLVVFSNSTRSGCGYAGSAMGPFYCPADQRVYIDLSFYRDLRDRFGAPGDFAQAYVLTHEIGHHVQHLLGIDEAVRAKQEAEPRNANAWSVRLELHADCLSGVWGNTTSQRQLLEEREVEEAMRAASAIGDDRLQRQATGHVNPESWTHGSSEQRLNAYMQGFRSGDLGVCNSLLGQTRRSTR